MENISSQLSTKEIKNNLIHMDLKFDSLSEYLGNFANVINQHAVMLNSLDQDTKKKSYQIDIADSLKQIANQFSLHDQKFKNSVDLQITGLMPETREDALVASTNLFSNKTNEMGQSLHWLYHRNVELEKRLNQQEQKITELVETKMDISRAKEKFSEFRSDIMGVIDGLNKKIYTSIEEQRNIFREEYDDLQKRICHCEDKTMHKIKKCKKLLKDKVDKKYVDGHFAHLEEKHQSDLDKFNEDNVAL